MTTWPDLLSFITARVPSFATTAQGVEVAQLPSNLPSTYAGFLRSMGRGCDAIRGPFGGGQRYDFDALKTFTAGYPGYHRVSFESDASVDPVFDHYLDLANATATDAPLVMIERGAPVNEPDAVDVGFTFTEFVSSQIFIRLGLERTKTETTLLVMHLEPDAARTALTEAAAALEAIGFSKAMPVMPRLACLTQAEGNLAARVAVHEVTSCLNIRLGGDDRVALETASAALRLALPTLRRRSTSGQFELTVAQ